MNGNWLEWLLGVSGDDIPEDARLHFVLTNLPQSWRVFLVLFAAAAAVYVCLRMYRADAGKLTPRARRVLAGLRVCVLLLLAFVALGPALSYTRQQVLQPVIVVLRDASQSMSVADRNLYAEERFAVAKLLGRSESSLTAKPASRAEIVNSLLKPERDSLLADLQQRGQLRVLDFAESVRPVEVRARNETEEPAAKEAAAEEDMPPIEEISPLVPSGVATNLHQALSEALTEKLTAAIILLTDGQHTDRATGKADLLALAEEARNRKIPLLVVGLGDPNPPRNVQITDVFADARVWKDDPFELQAVLHSEGLGAASVHVELVEQQLDESSDKAPTEKILEERDVELTAEGGQQRLAFEHTPRAAGRFAYTVRVQPVDRESTTADNQPAAPAEVKVIDDKARVLLVAGCPHWDYRFLRQLLEREKSVDVSCWLQTLDENRAQEGDTTITKLPRTRDELFAYDVIMLLDPDPKEFDDAWITLLEEFSRDHSGGLLYMAGPSFTNRFLSGGRTSKIRGLLPVTFGDVAATEVASLLESDDQVWDLSVVEASLDHPIMRFESDMRRSMDVWKLFPGVVWTYPVRDAIPTASTLLEHSDPALIQMAGPRPLLVSGQYGSGRTVFLAFEGTWRWREAGRNAEFFNRFWLQTVRYLVEGRSVEGKRRGSIETDRTRYEVGDRITVVARLNDATFKPLEQPEALAQLVTGGGDSTPVTLRAAPQQPGRFEAVVTALHPGRNILRLDFGDSAGAASPTIETTVTVTPPSVETARTWQDKPLLSEMAATSSGRYFSISQTAALPESIPDLRRSIEVQGKPTPLWDTSRLLLLVVLLLSVEWALRKKFKLL